MVLKDVVQNGDIFPQAFELVCQDYGDKQVVPLYHSNNDCLHVEHFLNNEYGAPYRLERRVCAAGERCAGSVRLSGRLRSDLGEDAFPMASAQRAFLEEGEKSRKVY